MGVSGDYLNPLSGMFEEGGWEVRQPKPLGLPGMVDHELIYSSGKPVGLIVNKDQVESVRLLYAPHSKDMLDYTAKVLELRDFCESQNIPVDVNPENLELTRDRLLDVLEKADGLEHDLAWNLFTSV